MGGGGGRKRGTTLTPKKLDALMGAELLKVTRAVATQVAPDKANASMKAAAIGQLEKLEAVVRAAWKAEQDKKAAEEAEWLAPAEEEEEEEEDEE